MTIIKGRLRPEGTNNYADVVHLETSADQIVETTDKKVMTAAERTKLNGIAAGAQVNPTAAQLLASIKTVDGAGSGLDADLLDGKQASEFSTVKFAQGELLVPSKNIVKQVTITAATLNLGITPKKFVVLMGDTIYTLNLDTGNLIRYVSTYNGGTVAIEQKNTINFTIRMNMPDVGESGTNNVTVSITGSTLTLTIYNQANYDSVTNAFTMRWEAIG